MSFSMACHLLSLRYVDRQRPGVPCRHAKSSGFGAVRRACLPGRRLSVSRARGRGCTGHSCPPEGHDMGDLSEGQTKPAGTSHEGQQAEDVSGVGAIAGCRPAGRREDASRLVEPERLTAQSTPRRYLANEEPALHGGKIGPAPRGKVKSETRWPISARDYTPNTRTSPASAHAPRSAAPRIWSVAPQSQCVADDRHRAQAHPRAGDDRAQQQPELRIEHPAAAMGPTSACRRRRRRGSRGCSAWWAGSGGGPARSLAGRP
jgi:hypothetical protein